MSLQLAGLGLIAGLLFASVVAERAGGPDLDTEAVPTQDPFDQPLPVAHGGGVRAHLSPLASSFEATLRLDAPHHPNLDVRVAVTQPTRPLAVREYVRIVATGPDGEQWSAAQGRLVRAGGAPMSFGLSIDDPASGTWLVTVELAEAALPVDVELAWCAAGAPSGDAVVGQACAAVNG